MLIIGAPPPLLEPHIFVAEKAQRATLPGRGAPIVSKCVLVIACQRTRNLILLSPALTFITVSSLANRMVATKWPAVVLAIMTSACFVTFNGAVA